MYLKHLSLTNFRNFARLDMSVPKGTVMLVGANAQGKTSLLEAIYLLATFVSFHAGSDREMVNFLAGREPLAVARIVADFCLEGTGSDKGGDHRLEIRIIQESNGGLRTPRVRKEVLLNGAKRKLSEAVGAFNAVMFLPQTLRIVEGAPEERRRYLNLTLAQVTPHYAAALSHYSRSLSQRNALLKQIQERGGDKQQLAYWDDQISDFGARLIHARIQAIQELEKIATRVHYDLTRGGEVLRLAYEPAYDPLPKPERQYALPLNAPLDRSSYSLKDIREGFLVALKELRVEEIARGVTTIGPHRDEVRFLGNGVDLGTYGSRGQIRTAVLALKLAEVSWMRARSGQWPVLLLDEVLAELDTLRRDDLLARLSQSEQALLTTTDLDLFSADFIDRSTVWTVKAGRLQE